MHYLQSHDLNITSIAISPDGNTIALGSYKLILLYHRHTGEFLQSIEAHFDWVYALEFNRGGNQLVSGSYDGEVNVWCVETGLKIQNYRKHSTPIRAIQLSPDGYTLAVASEKLLTLLNVATHEEIDICHDVLFARGMAWSPNGKHIAVACNDNKVVIYNAKTRMREHLFFDHAIGATDCAFSSDGKKLVSVSKDKTLCIYDLEKKCLQLKLMTGHQEVIRHCSYSTDSKFIASGDENGVICLWNAITGDLLAKFNERKKKIRCCQFSADSHNVIIGTADGSLTTWNISEFTQRLETTPAVNSPCISEGMGSPQPANLSGDLRALYEEQEHIKRPLKIAPPKLDVDHLTPVNREEKKVKWDEAVHSPKLFVSPRKIPKPETTSREKEKPRAKCC